MSEAPSAPGTEEEENRPYRRFVGVVFALAIAIACLLVLRGIIRHLDRLPSAVDQARPNTVDVRALRACAEDLDKLTTKAMKAGARALGEPGAGIEGWKEAALELELERVQIVARCRLDEPSTDPVVEDLERASEGVQGVLRSYGLLAARHQEDGLKQAADARAALERVATALKSR
ncbi:MAG: hypothetical protein U1E65_24105 [Myxococcota bacterium]